MSLFKFFHSTKTYEEDIQREKDCILRIKEAVSQKCGIDNFIEYDDFTVAFAGSRDNMELMLEICTQKSLLYFTTFSIANLLVLPHAPRRSRPPSALPATHFFFEGAMPLHPIGVRGELPDKPQFIYP